LLREKQSTQSLSPEEEEIYKQMNYSKEHEQKRKAHLERLLSRSPAEVAEEEALVIESRKLEAAAERMLQERADLLRLLDAPQSTGSVAPYQSSQGLAQLTATLLTTDRVKTKQKSEDGTPVMSPTSSAGPGASTSAGDKSNSSTSTTTKQEQPTPEPPKKGAASGMLAVQQLIKHKLNPKEEAAFGLSYHDKMNAGVYLRSSKVSTHKPSVQAKVSTILTELGLPARPTMPTAKVCAKFESLQHSIGLLLEAKKQVDKLETEIAIAKGQGGKP
jgi:DNA methyltransferase 1-associated protein 1